MRQNVIVGRKSTLLIYLTYTSTRVEHGGGSGMIWGDISLSVTGKQVRSDRKMGRANNTRYRARRKPGSPENSTAAILL